MKAVFVRSKKEAPNILTFYFKTERPLEFLAGQYAQFTLKHDNPDEFGYKRFFTLSSSPSEKLITITSKFTFTEMEGSTFKRALRNLSPGALLDVKGPSGDFVLPDDKTKPLVFVAGGIGITPFQSILAWMNAKGEKRDVRLLYGVRNPDEIVFKETFRAAGIKPHYVVSESTAGWEGPKGYLTADDILSAEQKPEALIYISGPELMTENLRNSLLKRGVKSSQILLDEQLGYTEV